MAAKRHKRQTLLPLAGTGEWSVDGLQRWVAGAIEAFTPARCMYGSNFPVDGICGSYKDIFTATKVGGRSEGATRQFPG
jgi:predicted TIM-barrel fold metal-dependent hydrolase